MWRRVATRKIQNRVAEISSPSASSSSDWLNSNAFMCCSSTQSDVITVKGLLNGHKARMLIDSGASGNFITQKFIDAGRETLNACLTGMDPKSVKLANGSTIKTNRMLTDVNTNVKNKSLPCSFVVLPELNHSYDAILGMPYLENANPDISFSNKTFNWRSNDSILHSNSNSQSFNAASINLSQTPVQLKFRKKLNGSIRCRSNRNTVILGGIEIAKNFLNPNVNFESSDKFVIANVRDLAAHPVPAPETNFQFNEISVDDVIPPLHPEAQKLIKQFRSVFPDELRKNCLQSARLSIVLTYFRDRSQSRSKFIECRIMN